MKTVTIKEIDLEMSNEQNPAQDSKKKMNLQEAIQQKLAAKKQGKTGGNDNTNFSTKTKGLKSQLTKKANNQRKRTGV